MTTAMTKPAGGCGGDGCDVRDPWPLHHVRHRGIFSRLCSSCVLKYHTGSFCPLCFVLIDGGSPATNPPAGGAAAVVHCTKCPSVSHLACLPSPDLGSQFVCPSCKSPEGFSYFPKEDQDRDGRRRMIDVESANVLLAAARLAANSMSKAAAQVRAEAERKVSEAAKARKRAREMLEKAVVICRKETERKAAAAVTLKAAPRPTPPPAALATEEPKRKYGKVGSGGREQKRVQSREIEKWMRFHEPILMPTDQEKGEKDKLEVGVPVEAMSRVSNSLGQEEKEKKGNVSSSQSGGGVKEEERSLAGRGEKGPRLQQATHG